MKSTDAKTERAFRRQVLKVRNALKDVPEDSSLEYRLRVEDGRVTVSSFDKPEEPSKVRVAVLMRPLIDPDSQIACRRVWDLIKRNRNLEGEILTNIEGSLNAIEEGSVALIVNQRRMKSQEIYETFAAGEFFNQRSDAVEMLKTLKFGPMTQLLWLYFYSYTHDMYRVASALLELLETGDPNELQERESVDNRPSNGWSILHGGACSSGSVWQRRRRIAERLCVRPVPKPRIKTRLVSR